MASFDRPREADAERVAAPDGAAHLVGLAELSRGQGLVAELVDGRLRVSDGPDGRVVEIECRRRPDDMARWWFIWADGIWLCEADHEIDALVQVKGVLRRVES